MNTLSMRACVTIVVVYAVVFFTLLYLATLYPVLAQTRTIYGGDGRVQARTSTSSNGNTTVYDAGGRVQVRTHTNSNGSTTVYGADGRVQSRISPPSGRR